MWALLSGAMAGIVLLFKTVQMMIARIDRPISHWARFVSEHRKKLMFVAIGMLLAGLNMITFMWLKPLLNYLVPFWADPYLAWGDRAIFGTDPWRLLVWLNNFPMALFYHRAWFALIILVLLKVLWSPASNEKSAMMLTYFVLWSIFGPAVHALLPAAGPIFYSKLGYGDTFSGLASTPATKELANYLWHVYESGRFGPASGISAMPSLHIATTVWIVIAVAIFARRWFIPMSFIASLIFLLSISLGWHYAVDGFAGGAGAVGIWCAARAAVNRLSSSGSMSELVGVDLAART